MGGGAPSQKQREGRKWGRTRRRGARKGGNIWNLNKQNNLIKKKLGRIILDLRHLNKKH